MGMTIGQLLDELQDTDKIMGLELVEIIYNPESPCRSTAVPLKE